MLALALGSFISDPVAAETNTHERDAEGRVTCYMEGYCFYARTADLNTGMFIELGMVSNALSSCYGLFVFQDRKEYRSDVSDGDAVAGICTPDEIVEQIFFDGACYFVKVRGTTDSLDRNSGTWTDPSVSRRLCAYFEWNGVKPR